MAKATTEITGGRPWAPCLPSVCCCSWTEAKLTHARGGVCEPSVHRPLNQKMMCLASYRQSNQDLGRLQHGLPFTSKPPTSSCCLRNVWHRKLFFKSCPKEETLFSEGRRESEGSYVNDRSFYTCFDLFYTCMLHLAPVLIRVLGVSISFNKIDLQ